MKRAARVDANQAEIVKALKQIPKCMVLDLSAVGGGCPDIAVGYKGRNIFFEIKDGNKSPSRRKLTPAQVKWHGEWTGEVHVITCLDDALEIMGCTERREPKHNSDE